MARFLNDELCIDIDTVVTVRPMGLNWPAGEYVVEVEAEAEEGDTALFVTSKSTALDLLAKMNEVEIVRQVREEFEREIEARDEPKAPKVAASVLDCTDGA
jgi:hypothetical protein